MTKASSQLLLNIFQVRFFSQRRKSYTRFVNWRSAVACKDTRSLQYFLRIIPKLILCPTHKFLSQGILEYNLVNAYLAQIDSLISSLIFSRKKIFTFHKTDV
jgi:hypothetical protein